MENLSRAMIAVSMLAAAGIVGFTIHGHGRYQLVAAQGAIYRLDTQTGAIAQCAPQRKGMLAECTYLESMYVGE